MVIGADRRTRRRNRRSIDELDGDGRDRVRRLLAAARFVVLPTSEAIPAVEARLAPGTVPLGVASTETLGIDQTVAVTEVLAARGYDLTPHLAARQVSTPRHLDEILQRLARRAVRRVLVVGGRSERSGAFPTATALLDALRNHRDAPPVIGIAGYPSGHPRLDRDALTAGLLARAKAADFVTTEVAFDMARLLAWVAEMRVRGLEAPIEVGIPGVVSSDVLRRDFPGSPRQAGWFDPTLLVAALGAQPAVDRLGITGIRLETRNEIPATADWRQQIYDLAHQMRTG